LAPRARGKPAARGTWPGQLRIIGGQWRGRRLEVLHSEGLRPTPDRVRETVFNWLQAWVPGADCLDLFAGSGALCLEALSRGARSAVMVERAHAVAEQLRRNIATLGAETAQVAETGAEDYLGGPVRVFDIVFVDPPFARPELVHQCLEILARDGWVRPGGWVYVEAASSAGPPVLPPGWTLHRSKTAGQVGYHLIQTQAPEAP
jgi:16S rRNA (guanine966-N2)-methyltransferase